MRGENRFVKRKGKRSSVWYVRRVEIYRNKSEG